ncbi:hypothetical protein BG005_008382 [Podila minutissima]|nr:hypothetical protein BG005_008382 [Podila minutissima]
MHKIRAPHHRRLQHHRCFLFLSTLLLSFILTPRVDAQEPTPETTKHQLEPEAAPPVGPGPPVTKPTSDKPTAVPKPPTNNPRPTAPTLTIPTGPIITIPTTVDPPIITTTTTTVRTFSDNIITIGGSSSTKSGTKTSRIQQPSETPYGYVPTEDKNGGLMLTVSLVVIFVVLSAMGLVVFCLFKRRNAKHRMGVFGKVNGSSTNGLDDFMSPGAEAKKRESIKGASGSEMNLNRESLQEMSEQHQNALMARRSSTLSLGSLQQQQVNRGSMLNPASPARPTSIGSNYWGGSAHGTPVLGPHGSAHNSMMMGNDFVSRPMSPEFMNGQYGEYYGPPHASYMYPGGTSSGAGSINYSSNEQLMQYPQAPFTHHNGSGSNMSRRSSLSPGLYPSQPEISQISPVARSKTISVAHSGGAYTPPPHQQQQQYYSNAQPQHSPYHSQPISVPAPVHQQPRTNSAPIPTIVSNSSEELSESNITTSTHTPAESVQGTSSPATTDDAGSEEQKRSLTPVGSGANNHHSSEHGWRPQSMSVLPGAGVGVHMGKPLHDDSGRPQSMMGHLHPSSTNSHSSSPANLVIPPSITTRRRSQMNNPNSSSIYVDHGMSMQPPMQGYYTNPHNVYYHQPPPPSTASSGSGSRRDSQPLDQISYQEVVVEIKDELSS